MASERAARLADLLTRWRHDLAAWQIPERIRAAAPDSPHLARRVPAGVPGQPTVPTGSRSYARAAAVLPDGGSVLDVGAGSGDASLVLAPPATLVTGVDVDARQLDVLRRRAVARGVTARIVVGRWPQVAPEVDPADVVTCHHVLYGVADLEPFVAALTRHARARVVIEIPAQHPHAPLNPLWRRFHDLERPQRPTADDVVAILTALGVTPRVERWVDRDGWGDFTDFGELVERTRRRLCLPAARRPEVAAALVEIGVDPDRPRSPGTVGRQLVTIWWDT